MAYETCSSFWTHSTYKCRFMCMGKHDIHYIIDAYDSTYENWLKIICYIHLYTCTLCSSRTLLAAPDWPVWKWHGQIIRPCHLTETQVWTCPLDIFFYKPTCTIDLNTYTDTFTVSIESVQVRRNSADKSMGPGKSYLLKGLIEVQGTRRDQAAHLIGGTTVHNFFALDIDCNSSLEKGTVDSHWRIQHARLLPLPYGRGPVQVLCQAQRLQPSMGGTHVLMLGDPVQLPAVSRSDILRPGAQGS